jgi:biopolymer transport protein ExbB/TolQ
MENRVALLIDQLGSGENVFEQFAIEFAQAEIQGASDSNTEQLQNKVELIERRLQDLSEKINATNEHLETIYSYTISKTKEILSIWLPLFSKRNMNTSIVDYFQKELNKLYDYVHIKNIESKNLDEITNDFENSFSISTTEVNLIKEKFSKINVQMLALPAISVLTSNLVNDVVKIVQYKSLNTDTKEYMFSIFDEVLKTEIDENENTIYTGVLKVWIDTTKAEEANKFMYLISSVLSTIDNVELEIIDSGMGSLWQDLRIKITGWFAKEETKQILKKGTKALENYAIDRHIEPIEKTKAEKEKTVAEIKRLMSENDTQKLHKIKLEKEKAELESIKLSNLEKKLEIIDKLSLAFSSGLIQIDSDYRIELNDLLIIKQEDTNITIGAIGDIDKNLDRQEELDE